MSNLNHTYQHVFIHVPRTAGSSMEAMEFVGNAGHHTITNFWPEWNRYKYFRWGFVRHPVDRFVSAYNWLKNGCETGVTAKTYIDFVRNKSFNEWAEWVFADDNILLAAHTRSLVSYLCIDNKIEVDFVGRFENLQNDWTVVCQKLKVPFQPLQHRGGTKNNVVVDPLIEKRIHEVYAADFEIFKY